MLTEIILVILIANILTSFNAKTFDQNMIDTRRCNEYTEDCLNKKPYVIRQFMDQSVMSWDEGRDLCFNANDDEVDGMATLDISAQTITSLDEQFDLLRAVCGVLQNADGRSVNCWVGGKLNSNGTGYIFDSMDTNRMSYSPQLRDADRWGCVRNADGSCKKDIEGVNLDNGENFITLFQNRNYFFADWPKEGGVNEDFMVTAVVCNNAKFKYYDDCQCACDACDVYGDPHIRTFDGTSFHTPGECTYYAVTPISQFDEDFCFQISTENGPCFDGFSSCLQSVYLSLYDPISLNLQTVIAFVHLISDNVIETVVSYQNEGALNISGFVQLDVIQTWTNNSFDDSPYYFLLRKDEQTNNFDFGIWINSKYQSVNIQFRDLTSLNVKSLHLSSSRITLSQCFLKKSCGICGYYDGNNQTELMIRNPLNESNLINLQLTDNEDLFNPFDDEISELIEEFTEEWIDNKHSIDDDSDSCNDMDDADLCQLNYCNDECFCDAKEKNYDGIKQVQCDYDLAACLGFRADSIECTEWQNNDASDNEQYLITNAPHCARLVNTV